MAHETHNTTDTSGGGLSRKLMKIVGIKRDKTAEENQTEARNDEIQNTTETSAGGISRKLKKVLGIKRDKTAEENQTEAGNDGALRKVYVTQPVSRRRSNISVITKNRAAGKSIDDASLNKHSSKDESTNLDVKDTPESSEEQSREPEEGLLVKAERAFLGLGYYVGEGAIAGCKKVAELTK